MSRVSFLPPFVSARRTMQVLGVLLILTAAVSWLSVGVDFALLRLAGELRDGAEVARTTRLAHTRSAGWLGTAQMLASLATGALFVGWLYQARVNVRALGARRLRWRREWTFFGFLVPGLNALRPYQVVREVWQASDPSTGGADRMSWQRTPVPPLLACWWVGFLLFLTLELVAWVVLIGIDSAGERRLAYALRLVADASAAISASLAYFVVVKITDAQDEKHERFGGGEDAVSLTSRDAIASGG